MTRLRKRSVLALAVALVALGALLGINAFDEEPTPEARALFTLSRVPFAADSGWALMAGFDAPVGDDPRTYAAALERASALRKPGERIAAQAPPLEVRAADELLCLPQDFDCVRAFAQRPDSIADLVSDNGVLLARYTQLLGSSGLADVIDRLEFFEGYIPHFSTILRVQQVALSQAGVNAARGRPAEAIAWLEADAAFQRRWLEQAGSILTKMLAARALSRDFLVAGQVARSGASLSVAQWEALERIVAPLTVAQRALAPVQRIEAALFAKVVDELVADSRTTSRIIEAPRLTAAILAATLRRNATLNFAYPLFADWTTLDDVPSDRLAEAIERIEHRARDHVAGNWTWAYNFTGRSHVAEQRPQVGEYVYRVRDLDALAATIRCVIAMRKQGVTAEAASAFVAASPACIDPYEGHPLDWDPEHWEVSFKARAPGQVARFGGRGDRIVFRALP